MMIIVNARSDQCSLRCLLMTMRCISQFVTKSKAIEARHSVQKEYPICRRT